MRIDFSVCLTDTEGRPLREQSVDENNRPRFHPSRGDQPPEPVLEVLTLRTACRAALIRPWSQNGQPEQLSVDEGFDRFRLAIKLSELKEGSMVVDLSDRDRQVIKNATDHYRDISILIFGRCRQLLDTEVPSPRGKSAN